MPRTRLLDWLVALQAQKASDLYLTHGAPPMLRGDNGMLPADRDPLGDRDLEAVIADLTTEEQQALFASQREFNMSLDLGKVGRFRINMGRQKGRSVLVIRRITTKVPTLEELGLPDLLGELSCEKRGLVIVVGGTGSGKSTTLAAMIDHRNRAAYGHILTIEDPIEYLHEHKLCLVTQREVGTDTLTFDAALKNALRQKPDVILLGEIRDAEVMRHALNIAETGHLALATLHANNADQAMERIASFFEVTERRQIMLNLSFNVKGIVSQRLVHAADGGRAVALEVLLNRGDVPGIIRAGDTQRLKAEMHAGAAEGMRTFDGSLLELWRSGSITTEVALSEADDRIAVEAAMAGCAR